MSQATLFERPRKRPANSMAAKLWEVYGTTLEDRQQFADRYANSGLIIGRAADRAMAQWLESWSPNFKGITWRVVQDFRLKLGPAMGGGTHPHRGRKRKIKPYSDGFTSPVGGPWGWRWKDGGWVVKNGEPVEPPTIERKLEAAEGANGHSERTGCCMGCDPGPKGAPGPHGETPEEFRAMLEPAEPKADPKPLTPGPGPVQYVPFNSEPFLVDHAKRLEQEFLEVLLMAGQVGLEPGRISPEEAAQIAKRAAKALVDA